VELEHYFDARIFSLGHEWKSVCLIGCGQFYNTSVNGRIFCNKKTEWVSDNQTKLEQSQIHSIAMSSDLWRYFF